MTQHRGLRVLALLATIALLSADSIDSGVADDDVATAWRYCLERDNNGRGVVLIGHSQGARILQKLNAREIDGQPVQQKAFPSRR